MFKSSIAAALVFACCAASAAAPVVSPAFKCAPPTVQLSGSSASLFSIRCTPAAAFVVGPTLVFAGELSSAGTPPYDVTAAYTLDLQDMHLRKVGADAREDQIFGGAVRASTMSVAALPSQFSAMTHWDASSSVLSVQERPGAWRSFAITPTADAGLSLTESGVASTPVKNGVAVQRVELGKLFSRFAGKGADSPVMQVQLGLRDGRFEVLLGDTRAAGQQSVQDALLKLDKKPADMARAWALAAVAQYLGLDDEVAYANQKVAAHNPQLLLEFQENVRRITPFAVLR